MREAEMDTAMPKALFWDGLSCRRRRGPAEAHVKGLMQQEQEGLASLAQVRTTQGPVQLSLSPHHSRLAPLPVLPAPLHGSWSQACSLMNIACSNLLPRLCFPETRLQPKCCAGRGAVTGGPSRLTPPDGKDQPLEDTHSRQEVREGGTSMAFMRNGRKNQ